jgi:large subunit ribosomal protein L2
MGKRLKQQRRGSGHPRYRAPSNRWKLELSYRSYDDVEKTGVLRARVLEFVDDPARDSLIMKLGYENDEVGHVIAPEGIAIGDYIEVGAQAKLTLGSIVPLYRVPDGAYIFNIERNAGDGGKLVRTSGSYANVVSREGGYVYIKLPSKGVVILSNECRAQIGVIAGAGKLERPLLKAGNQSYKKKARHRRWPMNRGVHMSVYNHPHGGKQHHTGKPTTVPRSAPPGAKVGHIAARSTGRRKSKKAEQTVAQ